MLLDKHVIAISDVSDIILWQIVEKVIKIIFDKVCKSSKSNCKEYKRVSLTQIEKGVALKIWSKYYIYMTIFRVNVLCNTNFKNNHSVSIIW